MEKEVKEFTCRRMNELRCKNKIYRDNLGDLFDYPICEECQKLEFDKVTRLDDGGYSKLL
jgi:hypothetical protein